MKLSEFKVGSKLEFNLRSPKLYRRTWLIILLITFLIIGLGLVSVIFLAVNHSETIMHNLNNHASMVSASKILSYISLGSLAVPYLYLTASWIVGIDNITKSKNFHIFLWIVYTLSAILAIIAIILCFRSILV